MQASTAYLKFVCRQLKSFRPLIGQEILKNHASILSDNAVVEEEAILCREIVDSDDESDDDMDGMG